MCAVLANLIVQNANFKLQFIIAISASNINVKANTSYEDKNAVEICVQRNAFISCKFIAKVGSIHTAYIHPKRVLFS